MADDDPAVTVCFVVRIDDVNLGAFNGCQGLGCEVVVERREEGGNNGYVWQLPSRITYPDITLTRPLRKETEQVARWFAGVTTGVTRKTATIQAMRADGTVVGQWSLLDVVPVRWTGPTLDPSLPGVATETVVIAHHGFLDARSS